MGVVPLIVATGATAYVDSTTGNVLLPQPTGTAGSYTLATPSGTAVTVGVDEYNALRYLAQLAANAVDTIDKDDVSTPFVWNPAPASGTAGLLTLVTDPATLQAGLAASTNNTTPLGDRVVFGQLGRIRRGFGADRIGFVVKVFFVHRIYLVRAWAVKSTMGTTRA